MDFAKTLAVITGGASGLGRAVAERVVAAGGKAAILDLQEAAGQAAAKEIGASFFNCDVSIESNVSLRSRRRAGHWAASICWSTARASSARESSSARTDR